MRLIEIRASVAARRLGRAADEDDAPDDASAASCSEVSDFLRRDEGIR